MKLTCFALNDYAPKLVAARPQRKWMDEFFDRHPYRCLPLSIANSHGWEVLCPIPVRITWNGGMAVEDLTVEGLKPLSGGRQIDHFCRSNFSRGIVTFHLDYIFRTETGWDLLATGPFNRPKDNAYPLTGIIETDWLPYPFTMNWQIERPGTVVFEEGEPFCFIFPVQRGMTQAYEPEIRRLSEDAELTRQHEAFRLSRDEFMKRFNAREAEALQHPWQRHYFVGRHPDGTLASDHINRLRPKEPVDLRAPQLVSVELRPVDPRWEDDSPLNGMAPRQTKRNETGRRQIANGSLVDWAGTPLLRSQADAAGRDFLVVDDVMTAAECDALCGTFRALEDRTFKSNEIDPFWNDRFINYDVIAAARPEAGRLMIDAMQRAGRHVRRFFRLKAPIYADLLQIVRWHQGIAMPPHADNANPDGSPHMMAYRDLSAILYLNDDYDGGEFFFTALDVALKPKRGMLLALAGGFHHEHAVLRVHRGTRFTMPFFMTFNRERADASLPPDALAG